MPRPDADPSVPPASPLIIVYNTTSGLFGAVEDVALRACTPDDHPCRLTQLTRTALGIRRRWRRFLASLGHPVESLHHDQFVARHATTDVDAPAVFVCRDGAWIPCIGAPEINACHTLDDLERLFRNATRSAG